MHTYKNRWIKAHPNNVSIHGCSEPILTVLDVRGFQLRDLFLIGINDNIGALVVDEERVEQAVAALEPAYATTTERWPNGDWAIQYSRRELDGTEPNRFITDITLTDGTTVMRDGRWTC